MGPTRTHLLQAAAGGGGSGLGDGRRGGAARGGGGGGGAGGCALGSRSGAACASRGGGGGGGSAGGSTLGSGGCAARGGGRGGSLQGRKWARWTAAFGTGMVSKRSRGRQAGGRQPAAPASRFAATIALLPAASPQPSRCTVKGLWQLEPDPCKTGKLIASPAAYPSRGGAAGGLGGRRRRHAGDSGSLRIASGGGGRGPENQCSCAWCMQTKPEGRGQGRGGKTAPRLAGVILAPPLRCGSCCCAPWWSAGGAWWPPRQQARGPASTPGLQGEHGKGRGRLV